MNGGAMGGSKAATRREFFQNMSRGSKLKPEPDHPSEPKLRKCLKCGKEFMSEHVGERICPKCKVKKGWC